MNNLEFWRLIDESLSAPVKDEKPLVAQYNNLLQNLLELSTEDIMKFYFIFQKKYSQAIDDDTLVPIFYVINGGVITQEKYDAFIAWIISRGKEVYENILKSPDYICSILEYKPSFPLFGPQYKIFNFIVTEAAINAYTKKCDSNMNEDYQALNYPSGFLDSLIDEKGESITGLLDPDVFYWMTPRDQEIIAKHYPLTYEKYGGWLRREFGDIGFHTPEDKDTFLKLLTKEVQGYEPPVVHKRVMMVSCPYCQKMIKETASNCPHCKKPITKDSKGRH